MPNLNNKPYIQLIPILIGLFFASDDQTVVVTILPKIMLDLRIGVGELERAAWTITGYLIGYVAVMPIMGRFSDIEIVILRTLFPTLQSGVVRL